MILTDIITTKRIPEHLGNELKSIGLNYLRYATKNDFKEWMTSAGLKNIEIADLTPQLKQVWEERYHKNTIHEHKEGYHYLLNSEFRLGETIFYIYVKGEKL